MGRLTLSPTDLAAAMADPEVQTNLSVHGGVSHVVVEVSAPTALWTTLPLPGLGLVCPVIAVTSPDLVGSCSFADVVLSGDGTDGPHALESISRTIDAAPIASASFALLLRGHDGRTAGGAAPSDASVMAGLVAESSCYSMLQAGSEFAAWRTNRPRRPLEQSLKRVTVTRVDDLLEVTLDRPDRRNALDASMRDQLCEALTLAIVDPTLRVSLRGAGPAFSGGGDLDEFGARPDPAQGHVTRLVRSVAWLAYRLRARMEVRVHGACMGSGIEIPAFAGSVRAAEDTVIGLPELALGLVPGAGGTVSITHRVGRRRTAFLGLSGARIDACTALRWGLVDVIDPA